MANSQTYLNYANGEMNHETLSAGPDISPAARQKRLSDTMAEVDMRLAASPGAIPARKTVKAAKDMRFNGDRLYYGLNARRDIQKAMEWYVAAAKKNDLPSLSRLVGLYLDDTLAQDVALKYADKAAAAGFVTPAMLMLAKQMETEKRTAKMAVAAPALKRANEQRKLDLQQEHEVREEFKRECSAPGCDISGVRLAKCNACMEVAYCSVDCQRKDWGRADGHKETCPGESGTSGGDGATSGTRKGAKKPARSKEARVLRLGTNGQLEGFVLTTATMDVAQVREVASSMTKNALGLIDDGYAKPRAVVPKICTGSKVTLAGHVPSKYDIVGTAIEQRADWEWLWSLNDLQVGVYLKAVDLMVI
jgi:hypothetical protein